MYLMLYIRTEVQADGAHQERQGEEGLQTAWENSELQFPAGQFGA